MILSAIFRFRPANSPPKTDPVAMSWVVNHRPQVLIELCKAYEYKESATAAGSVLREMLKHQAAAAVILFDDGEEQGSSFKGIGGIDEDRQQSGNGVFWRFFEWIDKSSFEVAADAFTTFRVRSSALLSSKRCAYHVANATTGNPYSTQRDYPPLPGRQLRHVLRQIQSHSGSV